MKAIKIFHRDSEKIKLEFAYNSEAIAKIKTIRGYSWSKTNNAWLIPYTKEAYRQLKTLFPDLQIISANQPTAPVVEQEMEVVQQPISKAKVIPIPITGTSLIVVERRIIVKTPRNDVDTQYLSSIKYSRWDRKDFVWIVPNFGSNLELLKIHFKERLVNIEVQEIFKTEDRKHSVANSEVLCLLVDGKRLRLIYSINSNITQAIKKLPYSSWDANNKWWSVPYSEQILATVKAVSAQEGFSFTIKEEAAEALRKPRVSPFDIPNYRYCPKEYVEKLKELRYSENTISTYSDLFEEFINHHHQLDYTTIGEATIVAYLRYLVNERKISISYQNQSINAIKFYYERVQGGQRKFYMVDRPRRERSLPNVLSEAEVVAIFSKIDNLKHKAMMLLAYSAGLRVSELINLRINDIDSSRMQVKVTQSKGKKDRYTLLSPKALEYLRKYVKNYKPKEWLFEGMDGGQYSPRSAQSILKMAVQKAGIAKQVSMHTLRHSFATHLLEQGTDLRYIQGLLGHDSSRTTEIYTHITTKGFDQIKSPLDKLDI